MMLSPNSVVSKAAETGSLCRISTPAVTCAGLPAPSAALTTTCVSPSARPVSAPGARFSVQLPLASVVVLKFCPPTEMFTTLPSGRLVLSPLSVNAPSASAALISASPNGVFSVRAGRVLNATSSDVVLSVVILPAASVTETVIALGPSASCCRSAVGMVSDQLPSASAVEV